MNINWLDRYTETQFEYIGIMVAQRGVVPAGGNDDENSGNEKTHTSTWIIEGELIKQPRLARFSSMLFPKKKRKTCLFMY